MNADFFISQDSLWQN